MSHVLVRLAVLVLVGTLGVGRSALVTASTPNEIRPCITDMYSQCEFELEPIEYIVTARVPDVYYTPPNSRWTCDSVKLSLTRDKAIVLQCKLSHLTFLPLIRGDMYGIWSSPQETRYAN